MPVKNEITLQKFRKSLNVRGILLLVQVLLPFGLYFALRASSSLVAALIAAGFILSMLFLVWLG